MPYQGALGVISLLACVATSGSSEMSEDQSELVAAIERWQKSGIISYSYDFQRLCNCMPEAISKVHIVVTSGVITSVTYAEDVYHRYYLDGVHSRKRVQKKGSVVPDEYLKSFQDIDVKMGEMANLLAEDPPPYEFEAEYDSEIGFPCRLYIDLSGGAIDNELEFVVSNFTVISARSELIPGCSAGVNHFARFSLPD